MNESAFNISVVIPTYNRKYCLNRVLDSVLSQTYPAHEIIVIDDGSIDETTEFLQKQYPDIILHASSNQGVSSARNKGIKASKGNWIAFVDSDDAWKETKLEKQVNAIWEKPDYQICHTEEIWVRNGKRINQMQKHQKEGGWIFQRSLALCLMSPSSILVHKDIFEEIGFFDESLPACEDYDLWLRMTARYPVLFIEEPLIFKYGGHEDQLSKKYWGMDRFRIQSLKKIIETEPLKKADRLAAVNMLREKIRIYLLGARKRNKMNDIQYYETLSEQYES